MTDEKIGMVDQVLETLSKFDRKSARINVISGEGIGITDSKFGGQAYIPLSVNAVPMSGDTKFMLLAQFNLAQIPKGILPADKGILQFFIDCEDDCYGMDFDEWDSCTGHKVIFYPEIEDDFLSKEEVLEIYEDVNFEYSPIEEGEWGLEFVEEMAQLTIGDYRFGDLFVKTWNEMFPENAIESLYCDESDEISDYLWDERNGCCHNICGYPAFTQEDPRRYNENLRNYEVLFQMESEHIPEIDFESLWGDIGICNFFIRTEDLKNLDFSKVAYNWDCG